MAITVGQGFQSVAIIPGGRAIRWTPSAGLTINAMTVREPLRAVVNADYLPIWLEPSPGRVWMLRHELLDWEPSPISLRHRVSVANRFASPDLFEGYRLP
jgi:hypothetical protein